MNDDVNDADRRKRQADAFRKIVEAGQVPPVIPQPKTYDELLTPGGKAFLRALKIDPDK